MRIQLYLDEQSRTLIFRKALEVLSQPGRTVVNCDGPNWNTSIARSARGFYAETKSFAEAQDLLVRSRFSIRLVVLFDDAPWLSPLKHGEYQEGGAIATIDAFTVLMSQEKENREWAHRIIIEGPTLEKVQALYKGIMTGKSLPAVEWVTSPATRKTS